MSSTKKKNDEPEIEGLSKLFSASMHTGTLVFELSQNYKKINALMEEINLAQQCLRQWDSKFGRAEEISRERSKRIECRAMAMYITHVTNSLVKRNLKAIELTKKLNEECYDESLEV